MNHYGKQKKHFPVRALSEGVFNEHIAQQADCLSANAAAPERQILERISHKSTLPRTGERARNDFRQLQRCHLLSNRFTKHTFPTSKDRKRFLLLTIVAHLVSSRTLGVDLLKYRPSSTGPIRARICPVELGLYRKLDGVGPVDNRPSPNKIRHFVKKKIKKIHVTPDT